MKYLIALSLSFPILALAHTPYTVAECKQLSDLVYAMGTARDQHADPKEVEKVTLQVFSESKVKTFVQDEDDMALALHAVEVVYAHPNMTREQLKAKAYTECATELIPGLSTKEKL